MASKVKKTKRTRTHKESPNTAGKARGAKQEAAAKHNKENGIKPWEVVCTKRQALRIKAGKPAAWRKRQEQLAKYKAKGKNKVPA